jgi:hypothetical protein
MKSSILPLLVFLAFAALMLAGCEEQKPVVVDAPILAYSLRWVGVCAVLCSAIGGVCLVLAARNRRK